MNRTCKSCLRSLARKQFSANQWSKTDSQSRCIACISASTKPAAPSPFNTAPVNPAAPNPFNCISAPAKQAAPNWFNTAPRTIAARACCCASAWPCSCYKTSPTPTSNIAPASIVSPAVVPVLPAPVTSLSPPLRPLTHAQDVTPCALSARIPKLAVSTIKVRPRTWTHHKDSNTVSLGSRIKPLQPLPTKLRPRVCFPDTPDCEVESASVPVTAAVAPNSAPMDSTSITAQARRQKDGEMVQVDVSGELAGCELWDLCLQSKHGSFKVQGSINLPDNSLLCDLVVFSQCEIELKPAAKLLRQPIDVEIYHMNPVDQGKQLDSVKYGRMLAKVNKRENAQFRSYQQGQDNEWVWRFGLNQQDALEVS